MTERKYAMDFRREETAYVLERWLASQSCALVGVGSVGKSNLLRHLANAAVQRHYLGSDLGDNFKAIIVDPNMLTVLNSGADTHDPSLRAWSGYELLMHRLFLAFYPFELLSKEDAHRFYDAYDSLQDGNNPLYRLIALRYFEFGLEYLFRRGARIVFMFDEFEELLKAMPTRFFQNLRGLRDSHKSQLAYLTFTRIPLKDAAARAGHDYAEIESFIELFTDNTYFVGPYSETDAERMIAGLSTNSGKHLPHATSQLLIEITGGYAGLLRSAFSLIDADAGPGESDTLLEYLCHREPIVTECRTIWMSLSDAEQYILRAVAKVSGYDVNAETQLAINQLVKKRLLRLEKRSNQLSIHPLIFRRYMQQSRHEP